MGRKRVLRIGALNIKTRPEKASTYIGLLQRAYKAGLVLQYFGDRCALLGGAVESEVMGETVVRGRIDLFTKVDFKGAWFDLTSRQAAEETQVQAIKIPPNLQPGHRSVSYVFLPDGHRLFLEKGGLGPSSARKFFELLLNADGVRGHEPVEVVVEQDAAELQAIFKLKELRKLEIVITRPNPDDLASEDALIRQELERQRARKKTVVLEAEENRSLAPSEDTRKQAQVALSDGYVVGVGKNEHGRAETRSTARHPLQETVSFDEEEASQLEALTNAAINVRDKILKSRE